MSKLDLSLHFGYNEFSLEFVLKSGEFLLSLEEIQFLLEGGSVAHQLVISLHGVQFHLGSVLGSIQSHFFLFQVPVGSLSQVGKILSITHP
mmetsp:Transcript_34215/g.33432  ORF Transcript_34215/g.33432 Transcript_34215/m.33432 type:complete len:91 (+) Transcript_34215:650-922(+)